MFELHLKKPSLNAANTSTTSEIHQCKIINISDIFKEEIEKYLIFLSSFAIKGP